MRATMLLTLLAAALALAGCTNVYESGPGTDVECDVTTDESQLDDGRTNPLLCEREDNQSEEERLPSDHSPAEG